MTPLAMPGGIDRSLDTSKSPIRYAKKVNMMDLHFRMNQGQIRRSVSVDVVARAGV